MFLAELCVKRPVFTTMLVMALVVMGWFSYERLGLDLLPKIDRPTTAITTRLSGASPEEMETQVTKLIEEVVNTINGLEELRSNTTEGISRAAMATIVVGGQSLYFLLTLLVTPVLSTYFDDLQSLRVGLLSRAPGWFRERLRRAPSRVARSPAAGSPVRPPAERPTSGG